MRIGSSDSLFSHHTVDNHQQSILVIRLSPLIVYFSIIEEGDVYTVRVT